MPEFLRWVVKPKVGDRVRRTEDLRSCPYYAAFRDRTVELQEQVYETVKLEIDPNPRPWSRESVVPLATRSLRRASWAANNSPSGRRLLQV